MPVQGKSLLYPERQKCIDCGRVFEEVVIRRLYCSYWCAGMTPPGDNPQNAPRQCVTGLPSRRRFKKRYKSPSDIAPRNLREAGASVYECEHCGMFHFGHERHEIGYTGSGAEINGRSVGTAPQGSDV